MLTKNAVTVLEKRYLKKDDEGKPIETPEGMFHRVAEAITGAETRYGKSEAEVKETEAEFYRLMSELEFLPNSPTLMNAGRELGQLAACFVLPILDSMESIFETIKHTALIHKSGGGTGFSFSRLRPANDVVHATNGVSSGPISFMEVFNSATEAIKQGGTRRGANMGCLRIDHPNILDFITSKKDGNRLTNFNISVLLTEDFMKAAEKGEDYELINPRTGQVDKTLNARKVFDLIVNMAWRNGEPGIIFIDRINRDNPTPKLGEIESTNPCIAGDSMVSTGFGLLRIDRLAEAYSAGGIEVMTDARVYCEDLLNGTDGSASSVLRCESRPISQAMSTGTKETIKLVTKAGYELVATPDHRIMTPGGWVQAGSLRPGDRVYVQPGEGSFASDHTLPAKVNDVRKGANGRTYQSSYPKEWSKELGFFLGWVVGDGWVRSGDKNCRVGLTFGSDDDKAMEFIQPIAASWYGKDIKPVRRSDTTWHLSYHSRYFVEYLESLGVKAGRAADKRVPEAVFQATKEAVCGFLQGLFTADGTINIVEGKSAHIRLSAKSRELLKDVQLLLLNLGIRSRIYDRNRPARKTFPYLTITGEERMYTSDGVGYELEVSRDQVPQFLEKVGFFGSKHAAKIKKLKEKGYYSTRFVEEIAEIVPNGVQTVYDLTEPMTNSFIANGFVVHNCGEQPLLPYEACNLGSINLSKVVATSGGAPAIDYMKLGQTVRATVRFLDDVIDVSLYPLDEIDRMVKGNRKIGLGIMGFADMLIMLGIPYDSEQATAIAEELMSFIQTEGRQASVELASKRGVFPNFEGSIYDVPDGPRMRNATVTTIAPTGTLSIIAGCSSGVEPLFAVSYVRTVLDGTEMVEVNPLFEQVARDRGFFTEALMKEIARRGTVKGLDEVPADVQRVFVTAHDIAPVWHIKMQAAFQNYTDNAVSKTVNFPHSASTEDVAEVYRLAYRLGCKGVTVYRDGSRDEQVLTVGTSRKKDAASTEPGVLAPRARPTRTFGVTEKVKTGCGNLYVTINSDEEGLCEVFARMGKSGGCASSQLDGVSRVISAALRAGVKVESIIKQLRGNVCPSPCWDQGGKVLSCPDAIGIALEHYTQYQQTGDTTAPAPVSKWVNTLDNLVGACPDCGSTVEHESGCIVCRFCGFSKCG